MNRPTLTLRVADVTPLTPLVKRFRFVSPDGSPLPRFSGGAHLVVEMPEGERIRRNSYSLVSDPFDDSGYEIAVRREDNGRGGSRYMHERVTPGMDLRVATPANFFAIEPTARKHILIAGSIGITPFATQIAQLDRMGASYELHYAARSRDEAAGLSLVPDAKLTTYFSAEGQRLNIGGLLTDQPMGTHVYVCGPEGLIAAVMDAGRRHGWPPSTLHSEAFTAPPPGEPFDVEIASTGQTVHVAGHQSLLEALEAAKIELDWSCRGGACGRCETGVTDCHGQIEHNDHWLSRDDRASQRKIMPCMSRFRGERLVLDL